MESRFPKIKDQRPIFLEGIHNYQDQQTTAVHDLGPLLLMAVLGSTRNTLSHFHGLASRDIDLFVQSGGVCLEADFLCAFREFKQVNLVHLFAEKS